MSDPVAYAYYMINQRVVDERDRVRAWARLWKSAAKKWRKQGHVAGFVRNLALEMEPAVFRARRNARREALTEAAALVRTTQVYCDADSYRVREKLAQAIEALRDGE